MKKILCFMLAISLVFISFSLTSCSYNDKIDGEKVSDVNGLSPIEAFEKACEMIEKSKQVSLHEESWGTKNYYFFIPDSSKKTTYYEISNLENYYHYKNDREENEITELWLIGQAGTVTEIYIENGVEEINKAYVRLDSAIDYRSEFILNGFIVQHVKDSISNAKKIECYLLSDGGHCLDIRFNKSAPHFINPDASYETVRIYFDKDGYLLQVNIETGTRGKISGKYNIDAKFGYNETALDIPKHEAMDR